MIFSPAIQSLINALQCLPGVGPKSSQRMALHLLERNRAAAANLAEALIVALDKVGHCRICRIFAEETMCPLCADPKRDEHLLCIVESPADLVALEHAGVYRGKYFVLMGRLSPLEGLGPDALGFPALKERLLKESIEEVILATNSTMEGEATAHYLLALIKQVNQTRESNIYPKRMDLRGGVEGSNPQEHSTSYVTEVRSDDNKPLNSFGQGMIKVSRIAHGVPMGGELELIDGNTLGYALQGRIVL